ncbi:hypothetical protein NT6N_21410 [Oceaniferula spumae]|uniref:Uncharacterized protein n=1 Tax=Oceaniferula spumae TaxID=2979115 RepID=A0AAT9FM92_9BACT
MRATLLSALLLAVIATTPPLHGQQNDEERPPLIVRFLAVALPPRVVMSGIGDNAKGKLIDEAAIPPMDLVLQKGKSSQPVTMMLNVPSRNYLLKSRRLVITRGSASEDQQAVGFIDLELPADQGVFTVVFTRRPGQSSWEQPTVRILTDATSAKSAGNTRILNLTSNNIGIQAGGGRKIIAPGKQLSFAKAGKAWQNAVIYAQHKQSWTKLRAISGTPREGLVQTIICYPSRPKETKVSVLTCNQRNQDISTLKASVLEMDKAP